MPRFSGEWVPPPASDQQSLILFQGSPVLDGGAENGAVVGRSAQHKVLASKENSIPTTSSPWSKNSFTLDEESGMREAEELLFHDEENQLLQDTLRATAQVAELCFKV